MAKNKLTKMLTSPDKDINQTYGANGVLSRLFRQMLWDLDIGPARFGSLLQSFILDPKNGVQNNKRDQTSQRGNLNKEFTRDQMTWKVFCKALRFLQIHKFEFIINAHHLGPDKRQTLHSTVVDFGSLVDDDDDDEVVGGIARPVPPKDGNGAELPSQLAIKAYYEGKGKKPSIHGIDFHAKGDTSGLDPEKPFDGTLYSVPYLDDPLPPLAKGEPPREST